MFRKRGQDSKPQESCPRFLNISPPASSSCSATLPLGFGNAARPPGHILFLDRYGLRGKPCRTCLGGGLDPGRTVLEPFSLERRGCRPGTGGRPAHAFDLLG